MERNREFLQDKMQALAQSKENAKIIESLTATKLELDTQLQAYRRGDTAAKAAVAAAGSADGKQTGKGLLLIECGCHSCLDFTSVKLCSWLILLKCLILYPGRFVFRY